jgi:glutathione reductase (NADPH)
VLARRRRAKETLVDRHMVIATGARHAPLGIPGEDHLTTTTGFLDLDHLPPRVAFVGSDYIAMEFAHVAARAGAQVHILHRGVRPLGRFDADLIGQLVQAMRDLGVDIQVRTVVEATERRGDALVVHVHAGDETREFTDR